MFISPFPAIVFAFVLYGVRRDSAFHRWAFRFSAGYALAIAVLFAAWIITAMSAAASTSIRKEVLTFLTRCQ
jgi:hypothetical protein